jgi:hypothetical protein
LIDNVLASATTTGAAKSGYYYAEAPAANHGINTGFTVGSAPSSFNITGVRLFCSNEDGVIRFTQRSSGSTPISDNPTCVRLYDPAVAFGWGSRGAKQRRRAIGSPVAPFPLSPYLLVPFPLSPFSLSSFLLPRPPASVKYWIYCPFGIPGRCSIFDVGNFALIN